MEREIANLYPEPATKIFLDAVKMKLSKADSKKRISPKALARQAENLDNLLQGPPRLQLMSRQSAFLF